MAGSDATLRADVTRDSERSGLEAGSQRVRLPFRPKLCSQETRCDAQRPNKGDPKLFIRQPSRYTANRAPRSGIDIGAREGKVPTGGCLHVDIRHHLVQESAHHRTVGKRSKQTLIVTKGIPKAAGECNLLNRRA